MDLPTPTIKAMSECERVRERVQSIRLTLVVCRVFNACDFDLIRRHSDLSLESRLYNRLHSRRLRFGFLLLTNLLSQLGTYQGITLLLEAAAAACKQSHSVCVCKLNSETGRDNVQKPLQELNGVGFLPNTIHFVAGIRNYIRKSGEFGHTHTHTLTL